MYGPNVSVSIFYEKLIKHTISIIHSTENLIVHNQPMDYQFPKANPQLITVGMLL